MKGNELIAALTEVFRHSGNYDDTIVIETPGSSAYTQTVDTVERRGRTTVITTKRLIH